MRQIDPADPIDGEPTETLLQAAHRLEVAVEWVERAHGALLDFHHHMGHSQEMMLQAAAALAEAGETELGDRLREKIAPLDAIPGRWTYQIVDEFRAWFLEPVRAFEAEVRGTVNGGVRHRFEARLKRDQTGEGGTTHVLLPDPARNLG